MTQPKADGPGGETTLDLDLFEARLAEIAEGDTSALEAVVRDAPALLRLLREGEVALFAEVEARNHQWDKRKAAEAERDDALSDAQLAASTLVKEQVRAAALEAEVAVLSQALGLPTPAKDAGGQPSVDDECDCSARGPRQEAACDGATPPPDGAFCACVCHWMPPAQPLPAEQLSPAPAPTQDGKIQQYEPPPQWFKDWADTIPKRSIMGGLVAPAPSSEKPISPAPASPTQGETVADTGHAVIERWASNGPIAAPSPETATVLGVCDGNEGHPHRRWSKCVNWRALSSAPGGEK